MVAVDHLNLHCPQQWTIMPPLILILRPKSIATIFHLNMCIYIYMQFTFKFVHQVELFLIIIIKDKHLNVFLIQNKLSCHRAHLVMEGRGDCRNRVNLLISLI